MLRDYILGNIPAWAVGLFASITAQDWNTLILPVIVSAISAVSFAYRAAANREERRVHKHEAHMRKCEAIRAQMLICRDCISGALPVDNCNFEHRPTKCPRRCGSHSGGKPPSADFATAKFFRASPEESETNFQTNNK